jgi:hypothetical protein
MSGGELILALALLAAVGAILVVAEATRTKNAPWLRDVDESDTRHG